MLQQSELDPSFALGADATPPPNVKKVSFDALLLAEGEWSTTCTKLGVTKSIDRFTQAIGLVINMVLDPKEPKTKDPNMRSFTVRPIDPVGKAFKEAGIGFEFAEYLKGETHYIAACVKKVALFACGVLREDLPAAQLLQPLVRECTAPRENEGTTRPSHTLGERTTDAPCRPQDPHRRRHRRGG